MHYSSFSNAKLARKEWSKNYRYQGGWPALRRCWQGTRELFKEPCPLVLPASQIPRIDVVAFSVIPRLTGLWADFLVEAVPISADRVIIGDCSGGFKPFHATSNLHILPLLNYQHGEKLDLFMSRVCQGEFVIVNDDDVFWLDPAPWRWAMAQFEANPNVAVVALLPRAHVSSVLAQKVVQPMGSYCIIVRRDIWLQEQLSFTVKHPPKSAGYNWFYDTADFANVQLLKRGYDVVIAPQEIQQHLVAFEGTSSWVMRIQEHAGRIQDHLHIPLRQEKALAAIYTCNGLTEIIRQHYPNLPEYSLVPQSVLDRAENICLRYLDEPKISFIENLVAKKLEMLEKHLPAIRNA